MYIVKTNFHSQRGEGGEMRHCQVRRISCLRVTDLTYSGRTVSSHASKALFHKALLCIVSLSPTIIRALLARVHITFKRLSSSKKPISRIALLRTAEKMIISLYRPWNESIVKDGTSESSR